MSVALERLSTASGVRLMASPQTKDQGLVVWVKDVPLQDLMAKIADCAGAEWSKEESGYRLIRSATLLRTQEQDHARREIEKIQKAQAKLKEALAKEGAFDDTRVRALGAQLKGIVEEARSQNGRNDNWRHQQNVGEGLPVGRLARNLAIDLNPADLIKLDRPGRYVFSTTPNRMQLPLPKSASGLIGRYEAERSQLESFMPTIDVEQLGGLNASLYTALTNRKMKDRRVAKVLLEVRRQEFGSGLSLNLMLANQAGMVFEHGYDRLDTEGMPTGPPPTPPAAPEGEKPIPVSARSKAMTEAIRKAIQAQGGDFPSMPEPVRQVFLNPERHSIAELVLSDMLIGAAKAKGKNLVGVPTEMGAFFGTVMLSTAESLTPTQALTQLGMFMMENKLAEKDDWIQLCVEDPFSLRRTAFDRAAMGRLVRGAAARNSISIDEAAAFAATTPPDFERQFAIMYIMLSSPTAGRTFERMSWQALRFHGSLGPAQHQAFANGQPIPFGRLTPGQQSIFHDLIFGDADGMGREIRSSAPSAAPEEDEVAGYGETLKYQPTERFPNGLGPKAVVRRSDVNGDTVLGRGTYGEYPTEQEFGLDEFAYFLFNRKNNPNPEVGVNLTEFRFAKQRTLTYNFDGDDEYGQVATLKERSQVSAAVDSPDKLPADFMEKVREAMKRFSSPPATVRPPVSSLQILIQGVIR